MGAPKGNKNAVKNNGGQQPIYNSVAELQAKIEEYFNDPPDKKEIVAGNGTVKISVYTICGLAYHLGFESRQSFYDYEKKIEFSYIIKKARLRIEQMYEQNLSFSNATGSIFALKNMGWIDSQTLDHKNNGESFNNISDAELIDRITKLATSGKEDGA